MKTTRRNLPFIFLFIYIFVTSCERENNEEDNTIYNFCLVTKINSQGMDTGQYSTKIAYDNFDRITLMDWSGPNDMTVSYLPGKLIAGDAAVANAYTVFYLNADSTARTSASYSNGQQLDSNNYYYNNGYLIKQVRFTQVLGKDSSMLTYTNGNLTKIVIYNSNGTSSQATMEYNDIPSKSWVYQYIGPYANNALYMPWLGKHSANLIKTIRSEFNGNPDPANITYEMNASGYVKSYTMTFLGNIDRKTYEYRCR